MFQLSHQAIEPHSLRELTRDSRCGGFCCFEGWVRNHHEGKPVQSLEYSSFEPLALQEGQRIIAESKERFSIEHALCVHALGHLSIGDMAVYVAVSAAHRDAAFEASRYIIDEIKHRVPIWKKEHYLDGSTAWPNCKGCASPSTHTH